MDPKLAEPEHVCLNHHKLVSSLLNLCSDLSMHLGDEVRSFPFNHELGGDASGSEWDGTGRFECLGVDTLFGRAGTQIGGP